MKLKLKKWSFVNYESEKSAKHEVYTGAFYNSDYLVSEEPTVSKAEVEKLGRKLGFGDMADEIYSIHGLAFHHFIYGHSRFVKAPLKSRVRNDMRKLNSGSKKLQDALKLILSDNHYANTFFYLLGDEESLYSSPREIKKVIDALEKGSYEYLRKYKAHNSKPRSDYIYAFIFLLGVTYFKWTNKKPTVTWDPYREKFTGKFIEYVENNFRLLKKTHRPSTRSLIEIIKNIDFSEIKYF